MKDEKKYVFTDLLGLGKAISSIDDLVKLIIVIVFAMWLGLC